MKNFSEVMMSITDKISGDECTGSNQLRRDWSLP